MPWRYSASMTDSLCAREADEAGSLLELWSEHLLEMEKVLGYSFKDRSLLLLALTHESYAHEAENKVGNQERLEFLGDSVLELIVRHYLYLRHPHQNEGTLTQVKAHNVKTQTLAELADNLGYYEHMLVGRGERNSDSRHRVNVLADTFEAVLGAMYLDGGLEPCRVFVLGLLKPSLDNLVGTRSDFKSHLQEYTQSVFKTTPRYETVGEEGPPHARIFTMQAYLDELFLGEGTGPSKTDASRSAAELGLKYLYSAAGFDFADMSHIDKDAENAYLESLAQQEAGIDDVPEMNGADAPVAGGAECADCAFVEGEAECADAAGACGTGSAPVAAAGGAECAAAETAGSPELGAGCCADVPAGPSVAPPGDSL